MLSAVTWKSQQLAPFLRVLVGEQRVSGKHRREWAPMAIMLPIMVPLLGITMQLQKGRNNQSWVSSLHSPGLHIPLVRS